MLMVAALACATAPASAREAKADQAAVSGTIAATESRRSGFRAMTQKEAIALNLAGGARNNPDGTVGISVQGDKHRIDKVLDVIRAGNKKSSTGNPLGLADAPSILSWTRLPCSD